MEVWNHNFAYHNWIINNIKDKKKILDVGCGDGTLIFKLKDKERIVGIDINRNSINIANKKNKSNNIMFIEGDYLKYDFSKEKFDAIIFVASIHHMDMGHSLKKAKEMLKKDGIMIIVGLSKPSSLLDFIIEIERIIPCFLISRIKHMQTSEDLNIDVSYTIPTMKSIRKYFKEELKDNYKLKYGLFYRYLLVWKKSF